MGKVEGFLIGALVLAGVTVVFQAQNSPQIINSVFSGGSGFFGTLMGRGSGMIPTGGN